MLSSLRPSFVQGGLAIGNLYTLRLKSSFFTASVSPQLYHPLFAFLVYETRQLVLGEKFESLLVKFPIFEPWCVQFASNPAGCYYSSRNNRKALVMTKKVGRNDPCPCGSGKKYKKCCEEKLGPKRKFEASVISSGLSSGKTLEGKATKISTDFFNRPAPPPPAPIPKQGEPRKPKDDEPHHPPEADKPM